ncbi:MAG: DUF3883 domain-containing protein [Melioribacteraceae bacterium]|nr:DUF3883 domain-containing protein [Melioribacteraceae bacterium]
MDLKKKIKEIVEESLGNNHKGLKNIASAERILKQAYEGRYFFELIQNVRDANREIGVDGKVTVEIREDKLIISNTGAEFSEAGIESITNIGDSTKHSQEFIGHKGIGFKSILEITEAPRITTRHGTIFFSRDHTISKYDKTVDSNKNNIPLFFFPHYDPYFLNGVDKEIVTRIELPYKPEVDRSTVLNDFQKIKQEQLVLLGNIKEISCKDREGDIQYSIEKNKTNHTVELKMNSEQFYYKDYFPAHKVKIPKEIINDLDAQERDLFEENSLIDINFLLQLDENKKFFPIENAKLYLFYPLNITSGFRFLLHSYFIVSPDRKELRESPLNEFLFSEIGAYIAGQFLTQLKRSYRNLTLLDILFYNRIPDSGLESLYNKVQKELSLQKFIYDKTSKKFYKPKEIIIADSSYKILFPEGIIGKKTLIFIDAREIKDWLRKEFDVEDLTHLQISDVIEKECKRHRNNKNFKFFQNFYNYASSHDKLDLTGRKVLLTSTNELVSNEEDVFYRGKGLSKQEQLPQTIKKRIHFIHPQITISEFRDGRSKIGVKEFNTNELIRRLVKLFEDSKVPNEEVLEAILGQDLESISVLPSKEKILLPIQEKKDWLNPLTSPIYFDISELRSLYPNGSFIDKTLFPTIPENRIEMFLKRVGVWDIPAIFVHTTDREVPAGSSTERRLARYSGLSSRPFFIKNDRLLDMPNKPNKWFTDTIIQNWSDYRKFLTGSSLPSFNYSSRDSYWRNVYYKDSWPFTGFLDTLYNEKWIVLNDSNEPLGCGNVVGMDQFDFQQSHLQVVKKYLNIIPSTYPLVKDLFKELGIIHLDSESIEDFRSLFQLIHRTYANTEFDQKEFTSFFNKILTKLFSYYAYRSTEGEKEILEMKDVPLLASNEFTGMIAWKTAGEIFYRDTPGFYKQLSNSVKKLLQPQFTNQDKNTIGRIGSKIGRRISQVLSQELIDEQDLNEVSICTKFPLLPEMISLLELDIDRSLSVDEMSRLKNTIVVERNAIQVMIKIDGTDKSETFSQSHFSLNSDPWRLYIVQDPLQDQKIISAQAINNLFASIIGRELKRVEVDVKNLLNTTNSNSYLESYNISLERVVEIRNFLESKTFNNKQQFYLNLIRVHTIPFDGKFFSERDVEHQEIANSLNVDTASLIQFDKNFDFENTSDSANIHHLETLFELLGITLSGFNEYATIKFNFKKFHFDQMNQLKNKLEQKFMDRLHFELKDKDLKQQSKFQSIIDGYKTFEEFNVEPNWLEVDHQEELDDWLRSRYPDLNIDATILNNFKYRTDIVQQYRINKSKFLKAIEQENISPVFLDEFLALKSVNSLLYFQFNDTLLEGYKQKYSTQYSQNLDQGHTNQLDPEQYTNRPNTQIEEREAQAPENDNRQKAKPNPKSQPKRLDGAGGKKQKERIGLVAEMLVYDLLKTSTEVNNLVWVSKYSSKIHDSHPGYNPNGDDILGYDLEYLDSRGNKIAVEVKGRNSNEQVFEISRPEIQIALKKKDHYRLIFVSNVLDNALRSYRDLGNPFRLDRGQDFIKNKKFKAINKNYEIHFK